MATYSTSQATRTAFIMAAGELFAERGLDAVSIRDIAARAQQNIGNIHYHFGGKQGLLKAVIDYALEPSYKDLFRQYLVDHEALFHDRPGRAQLVAGLIELHFKIVFAEQRPLWCGVLISQLLDRKLPIDEDIFTTGVRPFIDAFLTLYQRVSGDRNRDNAIAWLLTIAAPTQLLISDMFGGKQIRHEYKLDEDMIWKKLLPMTVRSALANVNLEEETATALTTLS